MIFKYETHVHCLECSACAHSSVRELAEAYKKAGYSGIFLTDHFLHGNSSVSADLSWHDFCGRYAEVWDIGKREGKRLGLSIFPGLEFCFRDGREMLFYGIDGDFLIKNTDLCWAPVEDVLKRVRDAGGLSVMAHPFRHFSFLPQKVVIPEGIDGIEVYNYFCSEEENNLALSTAAKLGLIPFSGTDSHSAAEGFFGKGGVVFERPVKDPSDFIKMVRSGSFSLIKNGEII